MKEIVFLLEEPSARAMIEIIIPKLIGEEVAKRYIVFEGKQDLEKQLVRKLRGYKNPDAKFIIMRDQDSSDCTKIKQNLQRKCLEANKPNAVIRIACKELESWYLADLMAVSRAYDTPNLANHQDKEKYRNPDILNGPSLELKRLIPEYQKIDGSRRIAQYLDINNSRSKSFFHFIKSIKMN